MASCPKELEAYEKAYKILSNKKDIENWQLGQYISASIGSVLSKKGKYPNKPMFQLEDGFTKNTYKESQEEVAIYEMKQRIKFLEKQGLPQSPM